MTNKKTTTLTLFSKESFEGESQAFNSSMSELGSSNYNDATSSLKIGAIGGKQGMAVLYEHEQFNRSSPSIQGIPLQTGEYSSHSQLGISENALSSFQLLGHEGAYLFPLSGYVGEAKFISDDENDQINFHQDDEFPAQSLIVMSGEWISNTNKIYKKGIYNKLEGGEQKIRRAPKGKLIVVSKEKKSSVPTVDNSNENHFIESSYQQTVDRNVELILDASGSMVNNRINNQTRFDIAKDTLKKLVTEKLPLGINFAFRAFGISKESYPNVEEITPDHNTALISPLSKLTVDSKEKLLKSIQDIKASGGTPIAGSIRKVPSDLSGANGTKLIVLITDGEETAETVDKVSEAITDLVKSDTTTKVVLNIVGFNITSEEQKNTFKRWAILGNGNYYDATDASLLSSLVTEAISPSFQVINSSFKTVAKGFVNDEKEIELISGETYAVKFDEDNIETGIHISFQNKTVLSI